MITSSYTHITISSETYQHKLCCLSVVKTFHIVLCFLHCIVLESLKSITSSVTAHKQRFIFIIFIDATGPVRVVVPLDLTPEQFIQTLRDNVPGVPEDFQLCRVNGQRQVVPLSEQCPQDIHTRRALQRSNLYLRPKVS